MSPLSHIIVGLEERPPFVRVADHPPSLAIRALQQLGRYTAPWTKRRCVIPVQDNLVQQLFHSPTD
jgi:hypothetical protein